MVEVLLRQCFAQSRLCGGCSAPLTEVNSTCSVCFSTCGFMIVFSPGWEGFPGRLPLFPYLWWEDCESLSLNQCYVCYHY